MSAELAHWTYTPFAKFYGESFMEQSLKNYTLIKELCLEFQREQCLRNLVQGNFSVFSDLLEFVCVCIRYCIICCFDLMEILNYSQIFAVYKLDYKAVITN